MADTGLKSSSFSFSELANRHWSKILFQHYLQFLYSREEIVCESDSDVHDVSGATKATTQVKQLPNNQ